MPAGASAAADRELFQGSSSCVLTPEKTIGPYFVDERLLRSDIRTDTSDGSVEGGVQLGLQLFLVDVDNGCAPVQGALVDVWHANAPGRYSDFAQEGTAGQDFLRGYQVSDANGSVGFLTVYPGWYSGRAVHIHLQVRFFNGSTQTYAFISQVFFDETLNAQIQALPAYTGSGTTTNGQDNIYNNDTELLVPLTGDTSSGFFGSALIGLTGLPAGVSNGDSIVDARLASVKFDRNARGRRTLKVTVDTDETVRADAVLKRGAKTLAREQNVDLKAGERKLKIGLDNSVDEGNAKLKLTLTDDSGNRKVLRRDVRVPSG